MKPVKPPVSPVQPASWAPEPKGNPLAKPAPHHPIPSARKIADLQNKVWNWPQNNGSLHLP